MRTLDVIIKDGLKALAVWLVIAVVLRIFFGYGGSMIAALIGLIFLVSFIALNSAALLAMLIKRFRG